MLLRIAAEFLLNKPACTSAGLKTSQALAGQNNRMFATKPEWSDFFKFKATLIDGTKVDKLEDIVGDKKAILVVNVASK